MKVCGIFLEKIRLQPLRFVISNMLGSFLLSSLVFFWWHKINCFGVAMRPIISSKNGSYQSSTGSSMTFIVHEDHHPRPWGIATLWWRGLVVWSSFCHCRWKSAQMLVFMWRIYPLMLWTMQMIWTRQWQLETKTVSLFSYQIGAIKMNLQLFAIWYEIFWNNQFYSASAVILCMKPHHPSLSWNNFKTIHYINN